VFGIRNEKLAGMAYMLTGVASFALMDAGLKLLTAHYPSAQVAALRGLSALPVVFAWVLYAGGAAQLLRIRWPLHLVRGVLSVFMMITFTFALKELSLARAYSLFFVAPMLIAVLSIVMLGEKVRRPQWIAIVIGFCGVLIVLKPQEGAGTFGWAGSLAILGTALCYALSSTLVKIIGRTDTTQSMVFWMTCMLAIGSTLIALPAWQPILREHYLLIVGVALTGAVGQWGITEAFKRAPAASVAPLEYSGLAWVIVIDLLVWSVVPQWRTLAGASVIIGSGIALLRYESRRGAETPP
jgi:drug/metabolite transporter (DMT)-like permease